METIVEKIQMLTSIFKPRGIDWELRDKLNNDIDFFAGVASFNVYDNATDFIQFAFMRYSNHKMMQRVFITSNRKKFDVDIYSYLISELKLISNPEVLFIIDPRMKDDRINKYLFTFFNYNINLSSILDDCLLRFV